FSPSGLAAVRIALREDMPEQEPGQWDYRVVIQPKDLQVRYVEFPYTMQAVRGDVIVTPDKVVLDRLEARRGDMWATVSGEVVTDETAQQADLKILALDVPIDEEFLAALPDDFLVMTGRFAPGGTCDLRLSSVKLVRRRLPDEQAEAPDETDESDESAEPVPPRITWRAEGSVSLHEAQANLGLGQKVLSGTLRGVAARLEDGMGIRARISLDSIQIAGRELTDVTAELVKATRGNILHIRDLAGNCHGGRAAGFAEIRLSDPIEYGVKLSVENVDLNNLFNAGIEDPEERSNATGRLAGMMQLIATADQPERRRASGVIQISEASLVKMPVLLGLMHVVFLQLPGDSAFSDGTMTYRLMGQKLIFDEIYLTGPSLSIVGSGTMDMETEVLEFTFLAGPPGEMPRLGHLSELLEGIFRELMEIQVTGTLGEPVTRTVPLRSVDAALRRLMNPEPEEE
ncbi:MAG: hypothetical protein ACYTFO_11375, partial [Planctomycetota bacterium]